MNAILKAHSSAWLDSKTYRLAWLMGPLAVAILVFGSGFWITPSNNLRVLPVPLSYTDEEGGKIDAGLKANDPVTLQALRAAAADDDLRALNYMGLLYDPTSARLGGVPPNFDVALTYFEKAAALGSVNALVNAGKMLSSSHKPDEACSYFQKAFKADASRGDAMAEAGYCMATENGVVAAEKAKGIGLMESAGAAGTVRAYALLGITYMIQTPPDVKQAISNFEKAVAGNIDDFGYSHNELGSIYLHGASGVPQDYKKAIDHFQKGYEQGSEKSAADLSFVYSTGTYGAPIDYKKAVEYAGFAAKAGNSIGHYNLYIFYLNGRGVRKNYNVAANHLLNAIALGYKNALEGAKNDTYPIEFIRALQSRLARAVLFNGAINGQGSAQLIQSLESVFDSKRVFE